MKDLRLVFMGVCVGIWTVTSGLLIPRALHAPTISLEEHGVVLKPGGIMSTADITHVQQGFRVLIATTVPLSVCYGVAKPLDLCGHSNFVPCG